MVSPELLVICGVAFLIVFALLLLLAVIMHVIILIFPHKVLQTDSAAIAAVTGTIQAIFPGSKIIKIEEKK